MASNRRLIHEHYFVDKRVKGGDHFIIRCITCDRCYCDLCGKILGAYTDRTALQTESRYDKAVLGS